MAEHEIRSLTQRAIAEVVDLHWFFEDWLGLTTADPALEIARFAAVAAPEFRVVTPKGVVLSRDEIIAVVEQARGSRGSVERAFRIRIEEIHTVELAAGLCLVTYVEHQDGPEGSTARRATALFREATGTPNGVAWLHLQETWLTAPAGG